MHGALGAGKQPRYRVEDLRANGGRTTAGCRRTKSPGSSPTYRQWLLLAPPPGQAGE